MQKRKLGKSGLEVSTLGLGIPKTWRKWSVAKRYNGKCRPKDRYRRANKTL
jgi:aryl-alcohol dehydrogenase-like predicted oxidoreductase